MIEENRFNFAKASVHLFHPGLGVLVGELGGCGMILTAWIEVQNKKLKGSHQAFFGWSVSPE